MSREELARAVHDRVAALPGVARLTSGGPIEVSTQYRAGRVPGVRLGDDTVEVHVAVDRLPLGDIVTRVRDAAAGALREAEDSRSVRVVVADVEVDSLPNGRG